MRDIIRELEEAQEHKAAELTAKGKKHQEELEKVRFLHEKALFEKEKALNEVFQKQLSSIQRDRDTLYEKHEKKVQALSDTIEALKQENHELLSYKKRQEEKEAKSKSIDS